MKKYWFLYKNHLATLLEYRSDILFTLIYESIGLLGLFLYWSAVFRTNNTVGVFNLGSILAYYLILPLIVVIVDANVSDYIGRDIRDGTLANYLLKPFKSQMHYITKFLAHKTVDYALLVPFYAIPFLVLAGMRVYTPDWGSLFEAIIMMFFSLLLYTTLDFWIGYLTFWLDDVWAFKHVKQIIVGSLGGLYFPLSLVQDQMLQKAINFLPFKYLYYTPLSYLLGKSSAVDLPGDILIILAWSVVFFLLAAVLWKLGLRKYEAYGR